MKPLCVLLLLAAACSTTTNAAKAPTDALDATGEAATTDAVTMDALPLGEVTTPDAPPSDAGTAQDPSPDMQVTEEASAFEAISPDPNPAEGAPPDLPEEAKGGPVAMSGVVNAREVGGLPTSDGRHIRHMALIRSGDLSALDQTGCQQFAALDIRTIIDLRTKAEADAKPDAQCAVSQATWHLANLPKILPPSPQSYLQTLDAACPALPAIFSKLAQGTPAIIHCVIGRDRAGIVTGLVLLAMGVCGPDVVQDFVANQEFQVEAAWMQAVVDEVAKHGGIQAFLTGCGVNLDDVALLRTRVVE